MKKLLHGAALMLLMLVQGCALALEVPSNAVFSPGLVRLADRKSTRLNSSHP